MACRQRTLTSVVFLAVFLLPLVATTNNPVLSLPQASLDIPENQAVDSSLLKCNVTDPDASNTSSSNVWSRFTGGNTERRFSLTASTCELYLLNELDYETTKTYFLKFTAQDQDGNLSNEETLTVNVLDVNDNAPACDNYVIIGSLPENSVVGTQIAQFTCQDADSASTGNVVQYSVSSGDTNVIQIDQNTGNATLKKVVDFDTEGSSFFVEVEIYDNNGGSGALTSTGTVFLYVTDEDDQQPVFESLASGISVREDAAVGTTIVTVTANDADEPGKLNSQVTYGFDSTPSPDLISIDQRTGDVVVKKPLDRETASTITATIFAYSGVDTANKVTLSLSVAVDDVNDKRPTFSTNYFQGNIDENAGTGSTVLNSSGGNLSVTATDGDAADGGLIDYTLVTTGTPFEILDTTTGFITVRTPPNYEDKTAYLLEVKATDRGTPPLSSVAHVQISINPENEFPPLFGNPKTFTVEESKVPGFVVGTLAVTDADNGVDGELIYSMVNSASAPFVVDSDSGKIRVASLLDHETSSSYTFDVRATDKSATTAKSTTQSITVTITDIDDAVPVCAAVGTQVIPDPLSINYIVATLSCTDADTAALTYDLTFTPDNGIGVFTMSDNRVLLSETPDENKYKISVDVTGGTSQTTTVSFVVITETQMNLTINPTVLNVDEGFVGLLTDLSITWEGVFQYTQVAITSGLVDSRTVLFSTSGEMAVVSPYDYEEHQSYTFTILATSRYGQEALGTLTINVNDLNDNTPTFSQGLFVLPINEDQAVGVVLQTYAATDADASDTLTYGLSGNTNGDFSINNSSGQLSLVNKLEYERTQSYTLVISATDGTNTGTAIVAVTVVQKDEAVPTIDLGGADAGQTSISIPETEALGSQVVQVVASDSDPNIVFTYSFDSGNIGNAFLIDGASGIVYVQNLLDRETTDTYPLVILAVDQNAVTATLSLTVNITDVNDNDPVFTPDVFEMYIAHNAPNPTSAGQLTVSDPDDPSNPNGQFDVSIVGATNFQLTKISDTLYDVETQFTADYEATTLYTFQVIAVDKGSPARTGTGMVAVHVQADVDQPKFDPTTDTVSVSEGIEPGTQIYDLDATKLGASELDNTMQYSIASSTPTTTAFAVRPDTGQVVVSEALDYETVQSYTLNLEACYSTNCMGTAASFTLTVTVTNVNDNTPVFTQEAYVIDVPETDGLNTVVDTIVATDADVNTFNTITYTLVGSSGDFEVHLSTGAISVKAALDYTVTNSYYYILTATDDGSPAKSSETAVIISITDENTHDPVFTSGTVTSVIDSAPSGAEIFHFHATDGDTGLAGTVTYGIVADSSGGSTFDLDLTSGILTTTALLDASLIPSYTLEVEALDQGTPPRNATSTLTITVVSTVPNNHDPVFSPSPASAALARTATTGTNVYTAAATDADTGAAGEVTYKILSGNSDGYFLIDSSSGAISTATSVLLAADTYILVVQAVDNGLPQRSSTLTLTVSINPAATVTTTYDYTFTINENESTGAEVGRINVDPDRTVSAYSIDKGNFGAFFIRVDAGDGNKGVIETAVVLDYETFPKYALLVSVTTDIGTLEKFVEIEVLDTNDHGPCFASNTFAFSIVEGLPVGTTVATVSYTDGDTLAANRDNVLTLDSPGTSLFSLTQTGALVLDTVPNFITTPSLAFNIRVADKTSATLPTCTMAVTTTIIDLSETVDVYLSDITTNALLNFEFPCQSSPGDVIYTLLAQDFGIDPPTGATVEFITNFNNGPIEIDSNTGTITVSNHQLECHQTYIRWVACRVSLGGSVVDARVSLLKIDTFDWASEMIVLTFAETEANVRANLACLKKRIQRMFSSTQRFGTAQMYEVTTNSRRRLLATSTSVFAYGVADTTADEIDNINTGKTFMTQAELLALIQGTEDGSPIFGISDSSFLTLTTAEPFVASTSADNTTFFETPAGIAVIVLICLFIVGLTAVTVFCIIYQRQQNAKREKLLIGK